MNTSLGQFAIFTKQSRRLCSGVLRYKLDLFCGYARGTKHDYLWCQHSARGLKGSYEMVWNPQQVQLSFMFGVSTQTHFDTYCMSSG